MQDYMDLDTNEKVRYMSESSNASTSGYSTMSPGGPQIGGSPSSVYSSPVPSPRTAGLPTELSNMHLPSYQQQQQQNYMQSNQMVYTSAGQTLMTLGNAVPMVQLPSQNSGLMSNAYTHSAVGRSMGVSMPIASQVTLEILEQPVEKFRFRYKSEMHGTHGSLNGANSKRTPKTFPEVKLVGFNDRARIRCSLFQWNLESPHSHQLVVRRDETDQCDPHEVDVSSTVGYVATFQNMGIIHTAKKYIFNELIKKKTDRFRFEHGREELSTKQTQQLHQETEKEAKDMDLNKVRLCFEAFKVERDNTFTRIAGPVYSNPINNRKSAQTGELRICRLSHSSGSVLGGEDLILLVEKVNKKNIKVRFFELNDDNDVEWEAFAKFRESDVHHQYAIVCQTPHYRNKDIDREVEVFIELVRPTDDERSDPPRQYRYKPRDGVVSRKRRRTCSAMNSFGSGSSNSLSSQELPRTVQEQTGNILMNMNNPVSIGGGGGITIGSMDFNRSEELKNILGSATFNNLVENNSDELKKMCCGDESFLELDHLETDGTALPPSRQTPKDRKILQAFSAAGGNSHMLQILRIANEAARTKGDAQAIAAAGKNIEEIFVDFTEKNYNCDSLLHEIIANDNTAFAMRMCTLLEQYHLQDLLNRSLNVHNESALHCACLHDRPDYIRPLLGLGCDPNIIDRRGNTALHVAVREQHRQCSESFLNAVGGVRLNLKIKNDEGLTPLHLAIRQRLEVAEKLIAYDGSAAHVANLKDGNTALHMAVEQGSLRLVKAILKNSTLSVQEMLLLNRNAAGHNVMDVAKHLSGDQELVSFLHDLVKDIDYTMIIKEEEVSSSSHSDEDDESSDQNPVQLIKIKTEVDVECDDDSAIDTADVKPALQDLVKILADDKRFQALVACLNKQNKWRTLAQHLKIQHLLLLWSNAEDMLGHVRQHASGMLTADFVKALALVLDGGEPQVARILGHI